MQPRPMAETSRWLSPSLRFRIFCPSRRVGQECSPWKRWELAYSAKVFAQFSGALGPRLDLERNALGNKREAGTTGVEHYSSRRAFRGSIWVARRAGRQQAGERTRAGAT